VYGTRKANPGRKFWEPAELSRVAVRVRANAPLLAVRPDEECG